MFLTIYSYKSNTSKTVTNIPGLQQINTKESFLLYSGKRFAVKKSYFSQNSNKCLACKVNADK